VKVITKETTDQQQHEDQSHTSQDSSIKFLQK